MILKSNWIWFWQGFCTGFGYAFSNFVLYSSIAYGLSIGALFVYYNVHWGKELYKAGDIASIFYAIVMGMF